MEFNRDKFNDTCGNMDALLDCVDELIGILNDYIGDDTISGGFGSGCYGKNAEEQVWGMMKDKNIEKYILDCVDELKEG